MTSCRRHSKPLPNCCGVGSRQFLQPPFLCKTWCELRPACSGYLDAAAGRNAVLRCRHHRRCAATQLRPASRGSALTALQPLWGRRAFPAPHATSLTRYRRCRASTSRALPRAARPQVRRSTQHRAAADLAHAQDVLNELVFDLRSRSAQACARLRCQRFWRPSGCMRAGWSHGSQPPLRWLAALPPRQ